MLTTADQLPQQEPALQLPERERIDGAVHIPVNLIKPNPWNRQINEKRLKELTDSVRQHGVLQPILVRPAEGAPVGQPLYELIAGERRWQASRSAGLPTVPALVRYMDDQQVIELMLIENLQREELHEMDEAAGYDRLLRKDSGPQALHGFASVEALAERLGKSRSYVNQRLRLLKLCPSGVKAFRAGSLTFSLALRIARLDAGDQAQATETILEGWGGEPMTARGADDYIQRTFMLDLGRATFQITDETLLPDAGSCLMCSKRTGNNPDLFEDIKKGDTCTDSGCFEAKGVAHRDRIKAQAEAKGLQIISGPDAKKAKPMAYGDTKGLLKLDHVHHEIDSSKTLRKLLGKTDIQPVLFEDPHNHDLVEMVPRDQALAALKASGVLKPSAELPTYTEKRRQESDANKRETTWRSAVAEACLVAARGQAGAATDYRQRLITGVAVLLWGEMHNDCRTRVSKLLGWPPLKSRWDQGPGITADQHIGALTDDELCRYLTAATIAGELAIASHMKIERPTRLLATAADLGVDVASIKASLRKPDRVEGNKAANARKAAAQTTPETALAGALNAAKTAAGKVPAVKFRCQQTGQTWTGRGLMPKWLKVALADGKTLQDFAADGGNATTATAAAAANTATPAATTGDVTHA